MCILEHRTSQGSSRDPFYPDNPSSRCRPLCPFGGGGVGGHTRTGLPKNGLLTVSLLHVVLPVLPVHTPGHPQQSGVPGRDVKWQPVTGEGFILVPPLPLVFSVRGPLVLLLGPNEKTGFFSLLTDPYTVGKNPRVTSDDIFS